MATDTTTTGMPPPTAGSPTLQRGLSVRGIGKEYSDNWVLQGVDLDVAPGEVVAVLGENGAGKSTLSSIIAGLTPASAGRMTWDGEPYTPGSPGEAIAHGIGLIHQEMRLLPDLTIGENVFVGRIPMKGGVVDRGQMNARAEEQLRRLGLDLPATRVVRTLRVAAQQQVEIAKALTLKARLLILDEPTASLGGEETERLFAQIGLLKKEGYSFIYISHRLEEIARVASRIVVLRDGRRVAVHDSAQVPIRTLVEQMVGRSLERIFPPLDPPGAQVVLEVKGLTSAEGAFRDVSFSVRQGEILGIAGIVGAGRTELVRAVAGADPVQAGTVWVDGKRLALHGPRDAVQAGVALIPEDRKTQGLILHHTVEENLVATNLDLVSPGGFTWPAALRRFGQEIITRMGVKGRSTQPVGSLSGGNQQKVVIGKWLSRAPRVCILDEPTRGIDVGARAAIYEVIAALARTGTAVVVVSSDLEEVLGLSHRVMVLSRGQQRGILDRAAASHVAVMELATT
ncbi:MAG: sugar ABC transporter ATP-binding protein [Anaeromyxobacter sp.]